MTWTGEIHMVSMFDLELTNFGNKAFIFLNWNYDNLIGLLATKRILTNGLLIRKLSIKEYKAPK